MEVLMVTAELSPYVRATETGDSVAALSRALTQQGHKVTVALPNFDGLADTGLMVARRLSPLELSDGSAVTVFDGQLPSGVGVVLFESKAVPLRSAPFGEDGKDYPDNAARFAMLCRAAVALCEQRAKQGKPFELVHAHDWPAAFLPLLPGCPPCVLTVHDPERQGTLPFKELEPLGLTADPENKERLRLGTRASVLKGGTLSAKVVTAISPTAALELKDPERFGPLATALAEAEVEIHGVLGGVDYGTFNPAVDTALRSRFDAEAPEKKGNSKTALCRELEFDLQPDRPLVVYADDIDKDAGADWVVSILAELLKRDVLVLVTGSGNAKSIVRQLGSAKLKRLENFRFIESNVPAERRRSLAAADIALVPSRSRLSGHSVRVAQRYGAVPVALNVAGNADAIVDCDSELLTGTGFLFDEPSPDALLAATERALAATSNPAWGKLRQRVMRLDLGWEGPARRYAQLYRLALKS